jgi:hypothetical protein
LAILLFLLLRKPKAKYGLAGQYSPRRLHELNGEGKEVATVYKDGAMEYSYPVSEMASDKEAPLAEIYKDIIGGHLLSWMRGVLGATTDLGDIGLRFQLLHWTWESCDVS